MRPWCSCVALTGLLILCMVRAGDTATKGLYLVEGVAAIVQQNQSSARHRAILSAFRDALEQTVADLVDTQGVVGHLQPLRTRLYGKPLQFLRSYRILWEYPDIPQKVYRVGLEAEVAVQEVGRVLDALGIAQRRDDPRRLAIFMAERYPGQTSQTYAASRGVVAEVLRREFQARGLRVIELDPGRLWDGQESSALAAAKQLDARIVLVGWAEVDPERRTGLSANQDAVQARVQVKALALDNSSEIGQAQVETTALKADGAQGETEALAQAALEIATRLSTSLTSYRR
ncbi:MAG: hypothetical protein AB7N91_09345 [Candidatus Tectimicrobiota bacterium]